MILFDDAILCTEATCQIIASARERPTHRCPICGSEMVSLAREEAKRAQAAKREAKVA